MKKSKFYILLAIFIFLHLPKNAAADFDLETGYGFSVQGTLGSIRPTKSPYLGTQVGAGPNIFNFVEAGDDLRLRGKGAVFHFPVCHGANIFGHVQTGHADNDQVFSRLDPGGSILLIPGVGVGPAGAGFSLAGPNNQIKNARYNINHDYYQIMMGVKKQLATGFNSLNITPSFGVGYGRATTENKFSGDIPFFVRSFDYETKTRITTISPTLGLDLLYKLSSQWSVFGGMSYAYDINRGRGRDSLGFTGFSDQVANIKNDENTHSYGVQAGINFKSSMLPIGISFQGGYKNSGNLPVIKNRNGTNRSDFSYEDADVVTGKVRVTFEF